MLLRRRKIVMDFSCDIATDAHVKYIQTSSTEKNIDQVTRVETFEKIQRSKFRHLQ